MNKMRRFMQRQSSIKFIILLFLLSSIYLLNIKYIYPLTLTEEAVSYREKGYEAQKHGNIDAAISWYQKAVSLNSNYATPHNDLGILFEAKGWLDRAELEYQKALAIDPNYAKAHTNLALLYERKGELEKASFHWMKRYKFGKPNDTWTKEAKKRLEKLGLIDKKDLPPKIETPEPITKSHEREEEVEVKETQKKEVEGWTRIGSRSKKKIAKKLKKEAAKPSRIKEKDLDLDKELLKSLELEEARLRRERSKKEDISKQMPTVKKEREKPKEKITKKEDLDKELQKSLKLEEAQLQEKKAKKKTAKWTRIGSKPAEKTVKKIEEDIKISEAIKDKKSELYAKLQESLRLAEERLRREKIGTTSLTKQDMKVLNLDKEVQETLIQVEERLHKEEIKKKASKKEVRKEKISDPGAKKHYLSSYKYYKKGEYSRALDIIRTAKKVYPEESSLLDLEQTIKNKMKEERIRDHYSEGMLLYNQEDYSGAKKEFEAILNILPE